MSANLTPEVRAEELAARAAAPQLTMTPENYLKLTKSPYRAAPVELRASLMEFNWCMQRFFPAPIELTALCAVWVRDHRITVDEIQAAMKAAMKPDKVGTFRFASDVTAFLGEFIATQKKNRARAEDTAREAQRRAEYQATYDREQAERRAKAEAAGQPKVTQLPATAADFYRPQTAADVTPAKPAHDSAAANAAFLDAVRSGKAPPAAKVSA